MSWKLDKNSLSCLGAAWEGMFDENPMMYVLLKKHAKKLFYYVLEKVQNHSMSPKKHSLEYWVINYEDHQFYRLFRMTKTTFENLCYVMCSSDINGLIVKKYRGGHFPILPELSILIFLWYMGTKDTYVTIGNRFSVSPQTANDIVNVCLFLIISLKKKYIKWPATADEYLETARTFSHYPGTVGAIDGSHIFLKVPKEQQDSYIDRYTRHSINLLAICNGKRIFTYIFVGFPGSAHDSRVFSNSSFFVNIQKYGPELYFPSPTYHLVGDSAFPIRTWLLTPYRRNEHLDRPKKRHNYLLSADRVLIENIFGITKNRWARIQFINTNSVGKACEIVTASCILHNFCYLQNDVWDEIHTEHGSQDKSIVAYDASEEGRKGREKRDLIMAELTNL